MLEITQIQQDSFEQTLHKPGSFAWWYIDTTNASGDGFVVVWALGLPFLPNSRELPQATDRPSLHLATYREFRPDFYLLQEYPASEVKLTNSCGTGSLGNSTFEVMEKGGAVQAVLDLSIQIPGSDSQLKGRIEFEGPRIQLRSTAQKGDHVWQPRSLCGRAVADLVHGNERRTLKGTSYFDGNVSRRPLHDQNIDSWIWGRLSFEDETVVYYQIKSKGRELEPILLLQKADGSHEFLSDTLTMARQQRGTFGVESARALTFQIHDRKYEVRLKALVDDGPFYQRFVLEARRTASVKHGDRLYLGHGIAEVVVPPRIDIPWQRPFVRMKTHVLNPSGTNSHFLPLFTGFPADRPDRLARTLMGGLLH